jgi:hypothetical protein
MSENKFIIAYEDPKKGYIESPFGEKEISTGILGGERPKRYSFEELLVEMDMRHYEYRGSSLSQFMAALGSNYTDMTQRHVFVKVD